MKCFITTTQRCCPKIALIIGNRDISADSSDVGAVMPEVSLKRDILPHPQRAGWLLLAALLAAGPALAQAPAEPARWQSLGYPSEGRDPAAAARAAMAPCGKGAVSQTWHMACMFEAVWGPRHGHLNHPPPHSAAFLNAAMSEAVAQTARYRTRESEVYRHLARSFPRSDRRVSYAAFLASTNEAFRRIPKPGLTVTAELAPRP
jgi:hypothetical protein